MSPSERSLFPCELAFHKAAATFSKRCEKLNKCDYKVLITEISQLLILNKITNKLPLWHFGDKTIKTHAIFQTYEMGIISPNKQINPNNQQSINRHKSKMSPPRLLLLSPSATVTLPLNKPLLLPLFITNGQRVVFHNDS